MAKRSERPPIKATCEFPDSTRGGALRIACDVPLSRKFRRREISQGGTRFF
jgi:hypothetical protein